jgi:gliding motility-associated-like protein
MKYIKWSVFLIITSLFYSSISYAQLYNTEVISVPTGTYMHIGGDLYNDAGTFENSGTIIITGDYTNDGYFYSGINSYVNLEGAFQKLGGIYPTTFSNLVIDGTDNKQCINNEYISETLHFNSNKIILGDNNLVLLSNAQINGATYNKYVVTDGLGFLIKKSVPSSTDFLFPVGDAINSFKPVVLKYTGTVDTFSTRVMAGISPTTGVDNECVQYTYIIEESNNGGSLASLSLGWNTSDEGSLFDRDFAYMWQNNVAWHLLPNAPGAEENLPFTDWHYTAFGITDFSSTANKFIVRENENTEVFIPNIFSPNNDGNNDVLFVRSEGIKELEFVIYDRWGEKIFETTDPTQGWDGTYKGKELSTAVFSYYVKATSYGGEAMEKKGNVTLVR